MCDGWESNPRKEGHILPPEPLGYRHHKHLFPSLRIADLHGAFSTYEVDATLNRPSASFIRFVSEHEPGDDEDERYHKNRSHRVEIGSLRSASW